jgi:signal transduction histidine kinase/CheY-like chemotaxis protein
MSVSRELEDEPRYAGSETELEAERRFLAAERKLLEAERRSIEEGYERMRRLFTQAPMSIGIYQGPEHRIEFANPTFLRVRGRGDEVIGRTYREVFPETQGAGVVVLDDAYRSGEPQLVPEVRVLLDRGHGPEEAFFHVSVVALKNALGEVERVMSVSFEVTDRVLARRALDAERAKLHTVFEQAPFPIGVFEGPEHRIVLANSKWEQLNGKALPVGERLVDALPELRAQGILLLHDRAFAGETIVLQEVPLQLSVNGVTRLHYFHVVLQPLQHDSSIYGHVTMALDVTEQVLTRTELETARVKAETASTAKDEFLAMLGHELRNPLAPIVTALNLMALRGVSGAERELNVISRQMSHLTRLVDDLLDVSRITRGKVELVMEPTELAEIVARALETASPLFEQRNQYVHVAIPRHGLVVEVDAARMAQAFSNLLTNAAKYSDSGGHVSVSSERVGSEVLIKFSDDGIGIRPEMLPAIFELFVQEQQALDRARGGLGLGLAIVKSVVTMHGGSIAAASAGLGKGSVFSVRLPASSLPAKLQGADPAPAAARSSRPSARRVLLVDDNEDAADLLALSLTAAGHTVRTAYDGPSALLALAAFAPEVALLDIGLPAMDGYELAERIRATHASVRLIALTGYGQETDRERTRAAGFDAHLVKPVELSVVLSTIER